LIDDKVTQCQQIVTSVIDFAVNQQVDGFLAPNVFNLRVVYDGRALAYSPGRALPLAGGTGKTVSCPF
jgi:hypothetical protein